MASIYPVSVSASLRKIIGPISMTVLITRVASTTKKTEQKARVKLHLCLLISLQECRQNSFDILQQAPHLSCSFII